MDSIRTSYFPSLSIRERQAAFVTLGHTLASLPADTWATWQRQAQAENGWFNLASTEAALAGILAMLREEELQAWLSRYSFSLREARKIGVVMAGNIPAVGFHDFLCVLLSGHTLVAKLSSQDSVLLRHIARLLVTIEPRLEAQIHFVEKLADTHATIATGSDNSARYFQHYFGQKPHIIRQNRSSCAILNGTEKPEELQALGMDILQYFGLGCRNVSKIYVPETYDFRLLLSALESLENQVDYHKYRNNYDYQKSILLVNRTPHYDNGFLLCTENEALVSPMAVIYYQTYHSAEDLNQKIQAHLPTIQCMVSQDAWYTGSIPLGTAQRPHVWEYADGVDTLRFLLDLE